MDYYLGTIVELVVSLIFTIVFFRLAVLEFRKLRKQQYIEMEAIQNRKP